MFGLQLACKKTTSTSGNPSGPKLLVTCKISATNLFNSFPLLLADGIAATIKRPVFNLLIGTPETRGTAWNDEVDGTGADCDGEVEWTGGATSDDEVEGTCRSLVAIELVNGMHDTTVGCNSAVEVARCWMPLEVHFQQWSFRIPGTLNQ